MAVTIPGLSDLVEVGRGGFAIVYRARQEAVGRVVAVKVLAALDLDSDQQRRFRQECRAMGTLSSHPNIVQVFDAGTSLEGLPYIAMEFMPGQSLWQRVKVGGPLSISELFAVGEFSSAHTNKLPTTCRILNTSPRAAIFSRVISYPPWI